MKMARNFLKTEMSKFGFLSAMLQDARHPISTSPKAEEFKYHLTH